MELRTFVVVVAQKVVIRRVDSHESGMEVKLVISQSLYGIANLCCGGSAKMVIRRVDSHESGMAVETGYVTYMKKYKLVISNIR